MTMPAAYGKLYIKDSNGAISQIIPEAYTINTEYVGATAAANGTAGLVPPALSAQKDKFLRGDGTWAELVLPSDYVGATSNASGTHGLVPAATSAEKDYYLKGDGTWGQIVIPTVSNYVGATSGANGTAGLVPAATSSEKDYFLRGDGTWTDLSTITHADVDTIFE